MYSGGAKKEILSHDKTLLEHTISPKDRLSCLYTNAPFWTIKLQIINRDY